MLITRRREGESLLIGDDVEIEIIAIGRHKVKIGVRAPDHVRVMRKEIQIVGERNVAAGTLDAGLRGIIVERLCVKSVLKHSVAAPIKIMTDTPGIQ